MKRTPLRRLTALKRYVAIRKMSPKRKRDSVRYDILRRQHLDANPVCAFEGCTAPAVHVHHQKKRGKYYLDTTTFLSMCFQHHRWIHDNENEARAKGLLLA